MLSSVDDAVLVMAHWDHKGSHTGGQSEEAVLRTLREELGPSVRFCSLRQSKQTLPYLCISCYMR